MGIKNFIVLMVFVSLLSGLELKLGNGKVGNFEKEGNSLRSVGSENIYYLNGKRDLANRYESNGQIIVSFSKDIDLKEFEEEFDLKNSKRISQKNRTYIFINLSSLDDGSLCEKIGKKDYIRYSYPNWNSKKTLY